MVKTFAFLSWLFLVLPLIFATVFQILMVINRKPDVKLFYSKFLYNPLAIQWGGKSYLTNKGRRWRDLSWLCIGLFLLELGLLFYFA